MVTNSSNLAWESPWTEKPGGLQFMPSQRVGHDWSDWAPTSSLPTLFSVLRGWPLRAASPRLSLDFGFWLGWADISHQQYAGRWKQRDVRVFISLLPNEVGFPCGSAGKESACNVGDLSLIPGLGRSPEEGKGYPLQYSGLENSMDCIVHGVTQAERLSLSLSQWGRCLPPPKSQVSCGSGQTAPLPSHSALRG